MYGILALTETNKVQICVVGTEQDPKPALFKTLLMAKFIARRMSKQNPHARLAITKLPD